VVAVPDSNESITAEWLSQALAEEGHGDVEVATVSYEPMPGIVGALGEIGIVSVTYADDTDLPPTFVAKCPLKTDTAQLYNQVMQYYSREAGFYRELAPRIDMKLAKAFVNVSDPDDSQKTMLLIEHVSGTDGDILAGADIDTMASLLDDLAKMHGTFWMSPEVDALPWAADWLTESFNLGIPITQQGWADFTAAEPGFFDPGVQEAITNRWVNDLPTILEFYAARPWTFIHGDYEYDNMIFTEAGPVVVDWQTVMQSFPGWDLAWYLGCCHTEETVAEEPALLERYREGLAAHGGPSWSADELLEDLAWGAAYHSAGQTVTNTGDYEGRAAKRFRKMLEGAAAAAVRWNSAEVLLAR
jgi:hypothetical protein